MATFAERAWEIRTRLNGDIFLDYISIFIFESCLYTAKTSRLVLYIYIYTSLWPIVKNNQPIKYKSITFFGSGRPLE